MVNTEPMVTAVVKVVATAVTSGARRTAAMDPNTTTETELQVAEATNTIKPNNKEANNNNLNMAIQQIGFHSLLQRDNGIRGLLAFSLPLQSAYLICLPSLLHISLSIYLSSFTPC